MRFALWSLVALVATLVVTLLLRQDNGYLLIQVAGWRWESSLVMMVTLFLAAELILLLVVTILYRILTLPWRTARWWRQRRQRKADEALERSLEELNAGHWHSAEKLLNRYAHLSSNAGLYWLTAARVAQLQGSYLRRDRYLLEAKNHTKEHPDKKICVWMTEAELCSSHHQLDRAIVCLEQVLKVEPNHSHALDMLSRAYRESGRWHALKTLLPAIERNAAFSHNHAIDLSVQTYAQLFAGTAEHADKDMVFELWRRLPRTLRYEPLVLAAGVEALSGIGETDKAVDTLEDALGHCWDAALIRVYANLALTDSSHQLRQLERWAVNHPDDAFLFMMMAQVAFRHGEWAIARTHIEKALSLQPSAHAYALYGELLQRLDQPEQAQSAFRHALSMFLADESRKKLVEVPALSLI